jgi:hypothetical protein
VPNRRTVSSWAVSPLFSPPFNLLFNPAPLPTRGADAGRVAPSPFVRPATTLRRVAVHLQPGGSAIGRASARSRTRDI